MAYKVNPITGELIPVFGITQPATSFRKFSNVINQPVSSQYPGSFYAILGGIATKFVTSSGSNNQLGYINLYLAKDDSVTSGIVEGRIYTNSSSNLPESVIAPGGFLIDVATISALSSPASRSIAILGQLLPEVTYWLVLTVNVNSSQIYVYCADSPATAQLATLSNNIWKTRDNQAIYFLLKSSSGIAGTFHSDSDIAISATSDAGTALYAASNAGLNLDCNGKFQVNSDGRIFSNINGVLISQGKEIKGYVPNPTSINPQVPIYFPSTKTWTINDVPINLTSVTGLTSLGVGTATPKATAQVVGSMAIGSRNQISDPGVGNLIVENLFLDTTFGTRSIYGGIGSGRRIEIAGNPGGNSPWTFYNTGGEGIKLVDDGLNPPIVLRTNGFGESNYNYLNIDYSYNAKTITLGNNSQIRENEKGLDLKLYGGAAGTANDGNNGGDIYIDGGTPGKGPTVRSGHIFLGLVNSKIGIGTNAPNAKLSVIGGVTIATDSSPTTLVTDPGSGNLAVGGVMSANQIKLSAVNTPPNSAADTGDKGELRFCEDGIYFAIATNTWVRAVFSNDVPTIKGLDPATNDFKSRVLANGGSFSNSSTIPAIDNLITNLKADGIWNLLIDVGVFVGDNLAAAITKLKYNPGIPSNYINSGFTVSDYAESTGLRGGNGKYLDTGITASTLNPNSSYIAGYISGDCSVQTPSFFGTPERPNNNEDNFKLYLNYQGSTYGGLFFDQVLGMPTLAQGGFFAISKTSDSNAFFQGNDTQISTTVTTSVRTEEILFFVDRGGYFEKALKFCCIASGLSTDQSLLLKNRILTFQQALNRS